mmetsp:Transcript_27098/g.87466  ORF Transcript_27098/g.87466 Transcript_27098/m.87466 type:complete len:193 (+) Transcript_27098:35-613(+)
MIYGEAVFLNTLSRRYPNIQQPDINDQHFVDVGGLVAKASAFQAAAAPGSKEAVGIDANAIVEQKRLEVNNTKKLADQHCLRRALHITDQNLWHRLWIGDLFKAHMIISSSDGDMFYIVYAAGSLLATLPLEWNDEHLVYTLSLLSPSWLQDKTATDILQYQCHESVPLLHFMLATSVHCFNTAILREVCAV